MSPISHWPESGSAEDLESAPAWLAMQDAARRYREDESWRARIDGGEEEAISALMRDVALEKIAPDTTVRVAANDAGTFHFVLPPDPNMALEDESLSGVAGGAQASTLASVSSAGTFGCSCMPSTIGSGGSVSSAAPS